MTKVTQEDGDVDHPGDLLKELQQLNTDFRSIRGSVQNLSEVRVQVQSVQVQKDSFWAWIACGCAVMNQLFIFGTLNVYSLFLVKFQKEFKCSTGEAAWLGSMTMGLMKLFGPISSSLVLYLNNRVVMLLGAVLCSVSVFTSSFAPTFMTLFGTLCVPFALGAAFTITPAMVVPVDYFQKHQSLAMGFVAAGSSIGTLILAPVIQIMLDALNWRTTFRIHSSSLASLVILNCFIKPVERNKDMDELKKPFLKSVIQDLALWKNRVFLLWAFAMAVVYFGYQIPNILLASYAEFLGINASKASYIVMAMGGATTISRLITGKILTCQLLSRLHFKQTIFVVMGTSYLLLAHVSTIEGLYVFAVFRGFLDGAHIVMLPMLTASMVGRNKALLGWGYIAGAISVTYTIGPPLAGYVKDVTGNYKMSFTMAGLPMIASGLMLFWLPWAQRTAKVSNIMETSGSVTDNRSDDKSAHIIVRRPPSQEALELMPLDVPDIQTKPLIRSKTNVIHVTPDTSTSVIKHAQSSRPRISTVKSLSKSMPEPRRSSDVDRQTTKVQSEPAILISAELATITYLSKRKSGPLAAGLLSKQQSVTSDQAAEHPNEINPLDNFQKDSNISGKNFKLHEEHSD